MQNFRITVYFKYTEERLHRDPVIYMTDDHLKRRRNYSLIFIQTLSVVNRNVAFT